MRELGHHGLAGVGKSRFACAIGHKACRRDNRSVLYAAAPDRLPVPGKGRCPHRRAHEKPRQGDLILDDWGLEPLYDNARHTCSKSSKVGTASLNAGDQPAPGGPLVRLGNPSYADAILDRLIHNALRLELSGECMRRGTSPLPRDRTANTVTS
ncbi:ATP-binding protein [Mesorhizobium opportunistum]|uniref:ATP-binding protein n=1 Tax=Mesorhizobium opportunistum TaxID=593909 RepID=UPI00333CB908